MIELIEGKNKGMGKNVGLHVVNREKTHFNAYLCCDYISHEK